MLLAEDRLAYIHKRAKTWSDGGWEILTLYTEPDLPTDMTPGNSSFIRQPRTR
jgi:hypothetical protein